MDLRSLVHDGPRIKPAVETLQPLPCGPTAPELCLIMHKATTNHEVWGAAADRIHYVHFTVEKVNLVEMVNHSQVVITWLSPDVKAFARQKYYIGSIIIVLEIYK